MQMKKFHPIILTLLMFSSLQAESISVRADDFTLKSSTGENIRLNELAGQVVLVNFWASWCGPCRKELPKLEMLHQKYSELGVTILGINIDEDPKLSKKILNDITVNFPVLFDPENQISELYKVESMPSTFIIDKKGYYRFKHNGYLPGYEDKYEQQIKQLMRD